MGAVLCGLIYILCWKFLGYSPRSEWQALKRLPRFCAYVGFLVKEIVKSSFHTMSLIWSPKKIVEPQLVGFRS